MDSSAGPERLVPVVLSVLHGLPERRRCASDPAMAGDRETRRRHPPQLRAGRSGLPPTPAPGRPALGLRQPEAVTPTPRTDDSVRRPIRIGISSCLLGEAVRYDGGHKRHAFLTETFGRFVEWVPVCPEVECGLGTPRESMRLVDSGKGVRLLTVKTAVDLTGQLETYARRRVA